MPNSLRYLLSFSPVIFRIKRISYRKMLRGSIAAFSFDPSAMAKETRHNIKKSTFLSEVWAVLAFR